MGFVVLVINWARASRPNMVSSLLKTLLLQGFITFHVRADSMTSMLADAEKELQKLFEQEQKELCGSQEIHKLLSEASKSNNRVTVWTRIEAIASAENKRLNTLISSTIDQLEIKRKELEAKRKEEKDELTPEHIKPMIIDALLGGDFDSTPDSPSKEQALENAKITKCGLIRASRVNRENKDKKGYTKITVAKDAFDKSIEKFDELVTEKMENKQWRIQPAAILKACKDFFGEPPKEEQNYCPEMCIKMSQGGSAISDREVGQTAGDPSDTLLKEVNELTALLAKYQKRLNKCEEGTKALQAFKLTLKSLETAIRKTFDAWFNANRDLDDAEESLDEIKFDIDNSIENAEQLKAQLINMAQETTDAETALETVQESGRELKQSLDQARSDLSKAKTAMETNDDALKAAELIKEKVAGIIEKLVNLYMFFVHEPINNLYLNEKDVLKVFDENTEKESTAAEAFKGSMTELSSHCENVAKPAFEKIILMEKTLDLTSLCKFGGEEASTGVVTRVDELKREVKEQLTQFKSYWKDFEVQNVEEQINEVSQPLLLVEVMEVFKEPTFSSVYMEKWKTGGVFLDAIGQLRRIIRNLAGALSNLQDSITTLEDKVKANIEEVKRAGQLVEEAIKAEKNKEKDVSEAERLLEEQRAQEEQQSGNCDLLKAAADKAYKEYQLALDVFHRVFIAGTKNDDKLGLLQKEETQVKS